MPKEFRSDSQIVFATRCCVKSKAKLYYVAPSKTVTDGETSMDRFYQCSKSAAFGAMFVGGKEEKHWGNGIAIHVV